MQENNPQTPHTGKPTTVDTPSPEKKEHYRFTMLAFLNPETAKLQAKRTKTFRGDYTRAQYGSQGMNLNALHDLAVLYKKYIEMRYQFKSVVFYDNHLKRTVLGGQKDQQVLKIIIDRGQEHFYNDLRGEYMDLVTGAPLKGSPLHDMPNQNI